MNLTTDFRPGQIALIRTRRDDFQPPTSSHLAMRVAQGWTIAWSTEAEAFGRPSYNGGSMTIFDYDEDVRVVDVVPLTVEVDVRELGKVGLSSTSLAGLGPSLHLASSTREKAHTLRPCSCCGDVLTAEARVQALIRQAIHNSHDATYRFPADVEDHVARVARLVLGLPLTGASPHHP